MFNLETYDICRNQSYVIALAEINFSLCAYKKFFATMESIIITHLILLSDINGLHWKIYCPIAFVTYMYILEIKILYKVGQ